MNTKVWPLSGVLGAIVPADVWIAKSDAIPVVAPLSPETAIVHVIALPIRRSEAATHDSDEVVVGFPNTINDCIPLSTVVPDTLTRIAKADVFVMGDVLNVKEPPPSPVMGTMEEDVDDEISKSLARPVVGPVAQFTEMVHTAKVPALNGEGTLQDNDECEVGTPKTAKDCEPFMIDSPD